MPRIGLKTAVLFLIIVATSFIVAYSLDQYYFAGRGYSYFFDILKLF